MHNSATFFSPAKLNLFFRVLHKRPDGYHEIASLYQAISLGDHLTIVRAERDQLTCNDPLVPVDETNLVMKALAHYRKKTDVHFPVAIHLEKNIPMQAGLGGGSGNAATALWAINTLNPLPLREAELRLVAGEFSSDAPFFLSSGTAYCTGRGERLSALPPLPQTRLWVAKPQEGLSTPLVYQAVRAALLPQRDPHVYLQSCLSGESAYFNDLEVAAFALLPKLVEIKSALMALGFSSVVMTGSGTAFFCVGAVEAPVLPGICFYPVSFLNRSEEHWYQHDINE